LCTDPGTRSDIPAWCRINGHRVLDIAESDGELVLTVEVGAGSAPGTPYD
jgi:tRNA 2-thiouridine synthesizing protein A